MKEIKHSPITRITVATLAATTLLTFVAVASSKLPMTWRNPHFTGGKFKNILVLAINGKASGRADYEDGMVAKLSRPGVQVVPSYSLLPRPEATPIDMKDLRWVIKTQKFDAVIVSRIVKFEQGVRYVPGQEYPLYPYYGTLYGYYGMVAPVIYTPGYMEKVSSAQVETNFYSTEKPEGELVWTGTSKTVNPSSIKKAINDIVKLLAKAIEKENLI